MKKQFTTITFTVLFTVFSFNLFGQIQQMFDVRTPMRDGVELSSDIWLPQKEGKYPAILLRTPYLKTEWQQKHPDFGKFFAENGYVFIVQDVRGRGDSDGEFDFLFQEGADGYDAIEWFAKQEWCNGRIGTMGISYLGGVQWQAAKEQPPHLVCMAPGGSALTFLAYLPGGAWSLAQHLNWLNIVSGRIFQSNGRTVDMMKVWNHRPLISQDSVFGREMRLYNEWLEHDTFDDYWERAELSEQDYDNINLPVLHTTGWFDPAMLGTMHFWNGMHQSNNDKINQYIVIGPWDHFQVYLDGKNKMGEIELGENSVLNMKNIHLEFFDAFLKTPSDGYDKSKARLFITGTNEWKEFDNYPPDEINNKKLYLQSQGIANSKNGNGSLTWDMSAKNYVDTFTCDPKNPAPGEFNSGVDCGKHEDRKDVLVYSSQVLEKPLTIIGNVSVILYASSDAKDTDFIARLIDVYPDGKAVNIGTLTSGGIIRTRYRNGYHKTELLTPNEPTKLKIDLYDLGHTFLQGHQIRLEISSSAFPVYCPNQNTGNPIATDTEWRTAHQTIYHDMEKPSHIVLPIFKK